MARMDLHCGSGASLPAILLSPASFAAMKPERWRGKMCKTAIK